MSEFISTPEEKRRAKLENEIKMQARRKLKARRGLQSAWLGLGMMGLVGWSIVIPTLVGAALGAWLDRRSESQYSYTLSFLLAGLFFGSLTAARWVAKENKAMREDEDNE